MMVGNEESQHRPAGDAPPPQTAFRNMPERADANQTPDQLQISGIADSSDNGDEEAAQ
jgi:hypothetical protein